MRWSAWLTPASATFARTERAAASVDPVGMVASPTRRLALIGDRRAHAAIPARTLVSGSNRRRCPERLRARENRALP
jgi:hypothetical protein